MMCATGIGIQSEESRTGTTDDVLVDVRELSVRYPLRKGAILRRVAGYVHAVDGVSLTIKRGQTYGLVGESGCGKSTFGRALLHLERAAQGTVLLDGVEVTQLRGAALRTMRRRMQMVFQDPMGSLDPRQSVEQLLFEGMRAHGITGAAARARLDELLDAVGLPRSSRRKYPHQFSGGQRQRIGIARALSVGPDLIVADEPVSALDVSIQAQVINLLQDLQQELELTYLIIAHDLAVVRHVSDVIGVMYLGSLVEEAPSAVLYDEPLHPYTRALLSAVPDPDPRAEASRERIILLGDLPSPADPPPGCRFSTR